MEKSMKPAATPFTPYQAFVVFILTITQFTVILDFMIMSPLGDILMKSFSLKPAQFGIAVSAYAFSAGVSGVLGVVALTGALCYPLAGRLADRYGARRIILFGNPLFAAALAALALNDGSLGRFYLLFTLVGISAAIPSTVLYTKVVSGWFRRRRGLFLGLSAGVGNGAGATVMPIVAAALIAAFGWRGAYVGLGLIVLLLGFPFLLLLLHDPPVAAAVDDATDAATGPGFSLGQARRTTTFWTILIAIALGAGSMTAVFAHVIPMLLDRGMPMSQATTVLSVLALVAVIWQVTIGHLLDRVRTPRIALPFYLCALVGVLLFQHAATLAELLAAAALMGIGLGTEYGVLPYYISRYFGLPSYGAIYGVIYGTVVLTMGITPFLMDRVFDASGSYDHAIYAIAVALALGGVLIGRLRPYEDLPGSRLAAAAPMQPSSTS